MDSSQLQTIFKLLDDIYYKIEKMSRETLALDEFSHLTIAEAKTIFSIGDKEPKTMKQISAELGIAPNTATVAVDRLVLKGIAQRETDHDDRRKLTVKLTPKGMRAMKEIDKGYIKQIGIFLSPLSDAEILVFKNLLEKIQSNI